jgi:hypothetical protein
LQALPLPNLTTAFLMKISRESLSNFSKNRNARS